MEIVNSLKKLGEHLGTALIIIFFLGGIFIGLKEHPWITLIVICVLFVFCMFIYLIFKGWDESENLRANDIRERYGEMEPYQDSHFIFKCKPLMPMVERSTSEKVLGFKIPDYEIMDSYGTPSNFNGDFMKVVELKFIEPLSSEMLEELERKCKKTKSRWKKDNDGYILTLDKIDLDNGNDHYHTVSITPEEMIITEGSV